MVNLCPKSRLDRAYKMYTSEMFKILVREILKGTTQEALS